MNSNSLSSRLIYAICQIVAHTFGFAAMFYAVIYVGSHYEGFFGGTRAIHDLTYYYLYHHGIFYWFATSVLTGGIPLLFRDDLYFYRLAFVCFTICFILVMATISIMVWPLTGIMHSLS